MKELTSEAVTRLLEWFRKNKRELPWRETKDPYKILVSEIMLQQTRVEAVKEYYVRFLNRFPKASSLAEADEEEVLKLWQGLGYYSRARNLQKASKVIAEKGFPETHAEIRKLPGVGDYTAGAIASIAFSLPCPAVDGNVLRVLTRFFADASNIGDEKVKEEFREVLKRAYPEEAGEFAESLMELGALVCLPNGVPLCERCPWETLCKAHVSREEERYPVRSEKKARKIVNAYVCVLEKDGRYALEKREEKGLLAGLWQFPFFETTPPDFGETVKEKSAVHVFTHVEWHMKGKLIRAREFFKPYLWAAPEEIENKYALPSAFKSFMKWITEKNDS